MILAKVTGPLFSINASGKFSEFVNYDWNGIKVVRPYVSFNLSNTDKQKKNRDLFAAGSKYYKLLTEYDREAWNRLAGQGMTGHNILTKLAKNSLHETGNFALIYDLYIDNLIPGKARINFGITADIELKLTVTDINNNQIKTYSLTASKDGLNSFTISELSPETKYSFIFKNEIDINKPPGSLVQINDYTRGDYYINYGLVCADGRGKDKLIKYKVELDKNTINKNYPVELKYKGEQNFNKYHLYRLDNNLGLTEGLIAKAIPPKIEFTDTGLDALNKLPEIKGDEKLIIAYSGLYKFDSF
ncbi:MAG: hypothetical protein ACOC1W_03285 [Bacillota bacterium]